MQTDNEKSQQQARCDYFFDVAKNRLSAERPDVRGGVRNTSAPLVCDGVLLQVCTRSNMLLFIPTRSVL